MLKRTKITLIKRTYVYIFFALSLLAFWMIYLQTPKKPNQAELSANMEYTLNVDTKTLMNLTIASFHFNNSTQKYILNSSKCRIPNINPFVEEILPFYSPKKYWKCYDKHLLTNISKSGNTATLHIDVRYLNEYDHINYCCYSYITRGATDLMLNKGECKKFKEPVTLTDGTIFVTCLNDNNDPLYQNVHSVVLINKTIEEKILKNNKDSNEQNLSVLFVGIDSISRLNLFRSLPKTYGYLHDNDWIEFQAYNKINDNTFPNLMAILTGQNESVTFNICNPRMVGPLDKCNFIWYDYRKLGFITGYAEDVAEINTFNYLKKGFVHPPTDYYFRTYILASERYLSSVYVEGVKYCTGPETSGERIFNVAKDFTTTFKNYSNFGFFWMNSYSHNELNSVSRMDDRVVNFLSYINETKAMDNSIVIFISDHGFRFGNVTYTYTGWLEERMPYFYMSVPNWFKKKYAQKYKNLLVNTKRLTTPYDLHMTLQDIIVLSGRNYTPKVCDGSPNCKSLFEEIDFERSCEDAAIPRHWCTCSGYFTISPHSLIAREAAMFLIAEIHKSILIADGDFNLCYDYTLHSILSARVSDTIDINKIEDSYFVITIETEPEAVFQATISINLNVSVPTFKLEGGISRLDLYKPNSGCVEDATLKKYCSCQGSLKHLFNVLKSRIFNFFDIF